VFVLLELGAVLLDLLERLCHVFGSRQDRIGCVDATIDQNRNSSMRWQHDVSACEKKNHNDLGRKKFWADPRHLNFPLG
jgi:hypothetical protein